VPGTSSRFLASALDTLLVLARAVVTIDDRS
jgi:hypothetical protein